MESLARGELTPESFRSRFWAQTKLKVEEAQIYVHCGQVLNLVEMITDRYRPSWWAAAVYRVAIIMWATSIANLDSLIAGNHGHALTSNPGTGSTLQFPIDGVMPEHSSIIRYLRFNEGTPVLAHAEGEARAITPGNVLRYCIEILRKAEYETPLVKGILARLENLSQRVGL